MDKILIKNITIQNPYEKAFKSDVCVENKKVTKIGNNNNNNNIETDSFELIDGSKKVLSYGLIDRHTHGGYGCNFNTCNEDELQNYLINAKKHGIVAVLPTIMTDDVQNINKQIALFKNVKSKGAKILGIHLEGPFINPQKKGIHPEKCILEPTVENLNKFDTDFIKVVTYAPELDKNGEFLSELKKRQIIPSIGHSTATYQQGMDAITNGAKQITHLFNALRPIHHREPSVITAALNSNDVGVEIIADLEHIHKAILEMVFKLKPKDKIFLISDSLPISYSNAKEDFFGGQKIFYDGKKATSKDGVLAGSTLFLDDIYKKISDFVDFKDFIGYASLNIAKSLGIKGFDTIKTGTDFEDLVIWDKNCF